MTSKEALRRLWQETAPATYMPDFDKKECCDVIEKDLDALNRAEGLLKALLQDMYVEYSGKDEVYIIKGVYDKKSKVYQQIQEYFKNI